MIERERERERKREGGREGGRGRERERWCGGGRRLPRQRPGCAPPGLFAPFNDIRLPGKGDTRLPGKRYFNFRVARPV